jgi:hypothetical protein
MSPLDVLTYISAAVCSAFLVTVGWHRLADRLLEWLFP